MKNNKGLKTALIISAIILVLCVALYIVAVSIYSGSFDYRCDTDESARFDMADFPELERELEFSRHGELGFLLLICVQMRILCRLMQDIQLRFL